ncbi:hypothetical protein [Mesorhizobium sp. M2A.F.Ca.ET.039.01.1.1]|uniref:hypothetical protein n=1 Tax=Mesorhizobium sp. M2A.F.Ca.ET.039.01.1.1 TaxID=2496746 RepID=UPI000FCA65A3|nr:hypothetical protein [Mesorhizobium sp. M2A.F.Ca.ET.039.01.1.1]RWX72538.1 hypothetical protein EOA24_00670 [Mesorhizobium sp. M2A.F.Ca.ET.039.01.1.1]
MEVKFVNPSPEMAAYQRAKSLAYMTSTLRASSADIDSARSVALTLAEAKFDPFLIALLGAKAARLAKAARKRKGAILNCIVAASLFAGPEFMGAAAAAIDVIC